MRPPSAPMAALTLHTQNFVAAAETHTFEPVPNA